MPVPHPSMVGLDCQGYRPFQHDACRWCCHCGATLARRPAEVGHGEPILALETFVRCCGGQHVSSHAMDSRAGSTFAARRCRFTRGGAEAFSETAPESCVGRPSSRGQSVHGSQPIADDTLPSCATGKRSFPSALDCQFHRLRLVLFIHSR